MEILDAALSAPSNRIRIWSLRQYLQEAEEIQPDRRDRHCEDLRCRVQKQIGQLYRDQHADRSEYEACGKSGPDSQFSRLADSLQVSRAKVRGKQRLYCRRCSEMGSQAFFWRFPTAS